MNIKNINRELRKSSFSHFKMWHNNPTNLSELYIVCQNIVEEGKQIVNDNFINSEAASYFISMWDVITKDKRKQYQEGFSKLCLLKDNRRSATGITMLKALNHSGTDLF